MAGAEGLVGASATVYEDIDPLGKIYLHGEGDDWVEQERLVLAVSGQTPHTWRDRPRPYDFYDLTGTISHLVKHFGWSKVEYVEEKVGYFDDEVSYSLIYQGKPIGQIGRLVKSIGEKLDIKQAVYVADMALEPLVASSGKLTEYDPLPVYPAAPRDLAIVVDETVKAGDLIATVKKAAGEIAETVELFDLYRGKQIEKGKKSIAISINYRSRKGNLSGEQVDEKQRAVVRKLEKDFKAQIRDK